MLIAKLVAGWLALGMGLSGGAEIAHESERGDALVFERYDTEALQVIFVARSEASSLGASEIDTEHLLLGVLRMGKSLWPLLANRLQPDALATEVEATVKKAASVPESADMPLTLASKAALRHAEEEAATLGASQVGAEHILLGLLREEKGYASGLLRRQGLQLEDMRAALRQARKEH